MLGSCAGCACTRPLVYYCLFGASSFNLRASEIGFVVLTVKLSPLNGLSCMGWCSKLAHATRTGKVD